VSTFYCKFKNTLHMLLLIALYWNFCPWKLYSFSLQTCCVCLLRPCVRRNFPNLSFSRVSEKFGCRTLEIAKNSFQLENQLESLVKSSECRALLFVLTSVCLPVCLHPFLPTPFLIQRNSTQNTDVSRFNSLNL